MERFLGVLKGEVEHSIMGIDMNKCFVLRYGFVVVEKRLREPHLPLLI